MAKINWTDEARRWLQEIYDYIARDNPDAAYRVVTEIHEAAGRLADFPELGFRYGDRPDLRILRTDRYRIAYRLMPTTDIDILGVFHVALDIERYLA